MARRAQSGQWQARRGGSRARTGAREVARRARASGQSEQANDANAALEPWQEHAQHARSLFRTNASRAVWEGSTDAVHAALTIAAEDDALQSKSAVMLPISSFTQRADAMVQSVISKHLSSSPAPAADVAAAVQYHLHSELGFTLPPHAERSAPMRVYQHKVLTQLVGTPVALGVIHHGVVSRLKQLGYVSSGKLEVVLPPGDAVPETREVGKAKSVELGERTATTVLLLWEVLQALKQAFWPWNWDAGEPNGGFKAAARGALNTNGRIGRAHSGTVVPSEGRPMGDLTCARIACERLVELQGRGKEEARDLGALLVHLGFPSEAEPYLREYLESSERDELSQSDKEDLELAADLLGHTRRRSLEMSFNAPAVSPAEE